MEVQGSGIAPLPFAFPDPATHATLYLAVAAGVVLFLLAQRVRVLRAITSFVLTAALLGLLALVVAGRAPFDPLLDRLVGRLHLDDQQVAGDTLRIRMSPDGHFWARVTIDGVARRMLVDSGATITAVSPKTAQAAGLGLVTPQLPVILRTANGMVTARTARVRELRLGGIVAHDLAVVVAPGFGDFDVLGMNFLSRLRAWRVEGDTLILEPKAD